jgi:hypothetical protein
MAGFDINSVKTSSSATSVLVILNKVGNTSPLLHVE